MPAFTRKSILSPIHTTQPFTFTFLGVLDLNTLFVQIVIDPLHLQVALWLPTTSSREPPMDRWKSLSYSYLLYHVYHLFSSSFLMSDSSQKAKLLAQLKAIDGDSPYRWIYIQTFKSCILIYSHIFNKDTVHLKWDFCSKESIKRLE